MEPIVFQTNPAAIFVGFVAHPASYARKVRHPAEVVLEQPRTGNATQIANLLALPTLLTAVIHIVKPAWLTWSAIPLTL